MEKLEDSRHLYLDLMKRCLVNMIYPQAEEVPLPATAAGFRGRLARGLLRLQVALSLGHPFATVRASS